MPSQLHEVLVALLREHPEAAVTLVERALGVTFEGGLQARRSSETLAELDPAEYRADAVFELVPEGESKPTRAFIVEVQLRRDPEKRLTWPVYQVGLRRRLRCPVLLVVVAPSSSTAAWCAEPIDVDGAGGTVVQPFVVGPANMPVVTAEAEAAQAPELAVLSVIAHGKGPNGFAIGHAALAAFSRLDDERATLYGDLVFLHLSAAARAALEHDMELDKYEYQSDFARRYVSEGEAKGKANAVVVVLESRGFHVDDALRGRIEAHEADGLDDLLRRATSLVSLDDLFA